MSHALEEDSDRGGGLLGAKMDIAKARLGRGGGGGSSSHVTEQLFLGWHQNGLWKSAPQIHCRPQPPLFKAEMERVSRPRQEGIGPCLESIAQH